MKNHLLSTVGILTFVSSIPAEIIEVRVPLDTPRKASKRADAGDVGTVPFVFHLPDGPAPIRGVYLNPFYLDHAKKERNHLVCAEWGFAVGGSNFLGVNGKEFGVTVNRALALAAEKSGRKELRKAPLLLVGMSAGAGMSVLIAEQVPDQVVAVGPVCLEVGPRDEPSAKVPMITVFGERDGKQFEKLTDKLPTVRAWNPGRWAIAPQWGQKHEFHRANNLLFPFFASVVAERIDESGKLQPWPDAKRGWLGSTHDWSAIAPADAFKGEPTTAVWLPDENVAHLWRAAASKTPAVQFVHPLPQGGGNPLIVHESGTPFTATIKAAKGRAVELSSWRLYDGSREIGKFDDAGHATVDLAPGLHALWAGTAKISENPSRPSVVLVRSSK